LDEEYTFNLPFSSRRNIQYKDYLKLPSVKYFTFSKHGKIGFLEKKRRRYFCAVVKDINLFKFTVCH